MRALLLVLTLLASTGCGDDCIDGICPDRSETRSFPGPCASAAEGAQVDQSCTFTYEDGVHVSDIACKQTVHTGFAADDGEFHYTAKRTWTGDELTGLETTSPKQAVTTWSFGPQQVTTSAGNVYDGAFAFRVQPGEELVDPVADLGLITEGATTYTWTDIAGGRLRHGGDRDLTYTLDARGRITSITPAPHLYRSEHFTYDGDHLVARSRENSVDTTSYEYNYDAGGNLTDTAETYSYDGSVIYRSAYDYSCWH